MQSGRELVEFWLSDLATLSDLAESAEINTLGEACPLADPKR